MRRPNGAPHSRLELPTLIKSEQGLRPSGDYDALAFEGLDLSGQRADRARLTQCGLHECAMDDVCLRNALIAECRWERVTAAALDTGGATWRDVELIQVRIGSLQAYDTDLTRVTVRASRLDLVNLRSAQLTDVIFERCVITDLDLGSSTARRVSFADCRLERVDCFQAELAEVDFSGAEVGSFTDVAQLSGAVISSRQLAELAPAMASHLGVSIEPDV